MSPSSAGVAGKPRTQRPGKSANEATKDKGKDSKDRPTPSYQPVRQELRTTLIPREYGISDSDSEGVRAVISSVKYPQPRIDHRTMNAHFCDVTQYGNWNSAQSANGDGVRYSNLAFMCFAEDAPVGSQHSLCTRQAFRVIRWWATCCRFTLTTWRLRSSTLQAHTTRPSRHSRTSRTTSPRRRRSSHCPHSSIVGSFNLLSWGQAASSSPRDLFL